MGQQTFESHFDSRQTTQNSKAHFPHCQTLFSGTIPPTATAIIPSALKNFFVLLSVPLPSGTPENSLVLAGLARRLAEEGPQLPCYLFFAACFLQRRQLEVAMEG